MHILSFRPELILYFYMASCVAVLVFNLFYIFADQMGRRRGSDRNEAMLQEILCQMRLLSEGGRVEEEHLRMMRRRLCRLSCLQTFEVSMEAACGQMPEEICAAYLKAMRIVFLTLTDVYGRRDDMERSSFTYLIGRFGIDAGQREPDAILEFCTGMVTDPQAYVRENALKALYRIGNQGAVCHAWARMEEGEVYHSARLLTDGLLSFTGDRMELARQLFGSRREYSVRLVIPVMQFIRFLTGQFQKEFLAVLDSEAEDKELRLETLRYFRRYPYEPAREIIQNLIRYQEYLDWEYAAQAALTLASYPGEDTVLCLKGGLASTNWYVRLNCAETLVCGLFVPQVELFDIYNGKDRFAREILQYATERAGITEQEMELGGAHV